MKHQFTKNSISLLMLTSTIISFNSCNVDDGLDGIDGQNGLDGINGQNGIDGIDGQDGQDGADGQDGMDGQDGVDNSGKTYLYLSGGITDEEAAQLIEDDFGSDTQYLIIENTTQLTTVDLTAYTESDELVRLELDNNDALASVILPHLAHIRQDIIIEDNDALQNISLPLLVRIDDDFVFDRNEVMTSLELPLLESTGNNFEVGNNDILAAMDLPLLKSIGNSLRVRSNYEMASLNLPLLQNSDALTISNNYKLASIDLQLLTTVSEDELEISGNNALETLSLPSLAVVNADIELENALSVTSVNLLLTQLEAITPPLEDLTIDLEQSPAAVPTGSGQVTITTLEGNGNTVNVDINQ